MRVRDRQTGRNTTMPTCGDNTDKEMSTIGLDLARTLARKLQARLRIQRKRKKKLTDRLDSGIECQAVEGDTQTQSGTQRLFLSSKEGLSTCPATVNRNLHLHHPHHQTLLQEEWVLQHRQLWQQCFFSGSKLPVTSASMPDMEPYQDLSVRSILRPCMLPEHIQFSLTSSPLLQNIRGS